MTRAEAIKEARYRYMIGEISADEYEVELQRIEYAHGEAMGAEDVE